MIHPSSSVDRISRVAGQGPIEIRRVVRSSSTRVTSSSTAVFGTKATYNFFCTNQR